MDEQTQSQKEVATPVDEKKEILQFALDGLRTQAGYGATIVAGKAQPILKVITPSGLAFSVTVK